MKINAQLYEKIMEKLEFEPSVNAPQITIAIDGKMMTLGGYECGK